MTKKELNRIVASGLRRSCRFLAVEIRTDGNPSQEVIVNPTGSVEGALAYYNAEYDDNLEMICAKYQGKRIWIADAMMTNRLHDLEELFS